MREATAKWTPFQALKTCTFRDVFTLWLELRRLHCLELQVI